MDWNKLKNWWHSFDAPDKDVADEVVAKRDAALEPEDSYGDISSDDLSTAVMRAMWPLPGVNPCMLDKKDLPELLAARKRCAEWRQWAETEPSLSRRVRKAYLHWCEYCERNNNEAAEQISSDGAQWKREMAEYDAENRRADARADAIKVPKPTFAKTSQW